MSSVVGCDDIQCAKCKRKLSIWWTYEEDKGMPRFRYSCLDFYHDVQEYPLKVTCHYGELNKE